MRVSARFLIRAIESDDLQGKDAIMLSRAGDGMNCSPKVTFMESLGDDAYLAEPQPTT